MAYEKIKTCARRLGLYRAARWAHRHVVDRQSLRVFDGERAFYAQFLKPGSLCFDVGANVGEKSEVFLALGARVVAFEPQRDCLDELLTRLRPGPFLTPVPSALGSRPDTLKLYIERDRVSSTFNKELAGDAVGSIDVPVTTLDAAIAEFGIPDYCKIDVEGYELEVLAGLSRPIPVISFEYHLRHNGDARALACLDSLSRFGDLLISVSPSDKPARAGSRWLNKTDFIALFRTALPHMLGYHYGDIFVRVQEPVVRS